MKVIHAIDDIRNYVREAKRADKKIAFVPTMGNLHKGHMSLIHKAKEISDIVIASVYVNPLQFGENEDFGTYPRVFEKDKKALSLEGVDCLFCPDVEDMSPNGEQSTRIDVERLSGIHCGVTRPKFFSGIATVVAKLFNIVDPDYAVFGEKDFQQLLVIRVMVQEHAYNIEIIAAPTIRESGGLACSSRNNYLTDDERDHGNIFYKVLSDAACTIKNGDISFDNVERESRSVLQSKGFDVDYISVVRRSDLMPPDKVDKELIIIAAVNLSGTRLIDNVQVDLFSGVDFSSGSYA